MGFLIFLFLLSPPDLCKTMLSDGTIVKRPCVHVVVPPPEEMPELQIRCSGDRFDRSKNFVAVTGYCNQRVVA